MDKTLEMQKLKNSEEKTKNVGESKEEAEVKTGHSFAEDLVQILANQESRESSQSIGNILENEIQQINSQEAEKTIDYEVPSEEPLKVDYGTNPSSDDAYGYNYAKTSESGNALFYSSQEKSENNDYWEKMEEERERVRRVMK